ncbi:polysaccharide deacetylase family protein [Streptomyces sp. G-G2]|uniref:polysaccharide deacetylase family protein n=1 Tax=Streptomyces sp. G-G2 TaxID=3046201 RepID=UPI0024BAF40F|nr:polysaccharide deacetylase family protein [Streptomyces sp. G-G2]MDJ0382559.1 polysaccharide deacetylase family protein [Streptomyces sp. G-G2]
MVATADGSARGGRPARRQLLRGLAAVAGATALGLASGYPAGADVRTGRTRGGAPRPPITRPLAGRDVKVLRTTEQKVALTFDCGSDAAGAEAILRTLWDQWVPATFFMTGIFAADNPHLARHIARRYPVGNHSMTHPSFPAISAERRAEEIRSAADAIETAIGRPSEPLFRFPFGLRTRPCIAEVNAAGYVPVKWTVDTAGWKGAIGGATTTTVIDRTVQALRPGAIVLMHLGSTPEDHSAVDAAALPALIDTLRSHAYGFTTLRDLFAPH